MEEEKLNPEEIINNLEKQIEDRREYWNKIIEKLSSRLTGDLKDSIQLEAESISYRQIVNSEIAKFTYKIYRDMPKLKQLRKSQFEFYSTKYQLKTNSSEKAKLTEADLAWQEAKIQVYESYIEYLSESRKNFDHIIWAVKNKIAINNITGLE